MSSGSRTQSLLYSPVWAAGGTGRVTDSGRMAALRPALPLLWVGRPPHLPGLGTVSEPLEEAAGKLLPQEREGRPRRAQIRVLTSPCQHTCPLPLLGARGRGASPSRANSKMGHNVSESFSKVRTSSSSFLITAPCPSTRSGLLREPGISPAGSPVPERVALRRKH